MGNNDFNPDLFNERVSTVEIIELFDKYEQNFSVMNLPGLTAEKIMKLRAKAYRSFYMSPRNIFRTLKSYNSLTA